MKPRSLYRWLGAFFLSVVYVWAWADSTAYSVETQPTGGDQPPKETPLAVTADEKVEEIADVTEVDPTKGFDSPNHPRVERGYNLFFARTTRANSLLVLIDHRTNHSISNGDFNNYLGFDSGGLKIGLGVRYGILDNLDAGVYRLNGTVEIFDTYEFDARFKFLNQGDHFLNLAVRAGISWFAQPNVDDAVGFFGQVLMDRDFFDCLLVGTGLLFHSDSSNDVKSLAANSSSLAAQLVLEWRIFHFLALDIELAANLAGYRSQWPVFAGGLKFITQRHTFSFIFTNNQYISADGVVANSWRGFEELILAFQISRELNF